MKRNRFALLLLLLVGGMFANTEVPGSHRATAASTPTHCCQHTAHHASVNAPNTESAPFSTDQYSLSERLMTAVDTFARLVMVI